MQNYLENICGVSSLSANEFINIVSIETVEAGICFVKEGSQSLNEYIILEGISRSYLIDQRGDDITLSFFTPNTPISPCLVRNLSDKSILNIEALTPLKLAVFATEDLMHLMQSNPEIGQWANSILQHELIKKARKEVQHISMSAKERLLLFREIYPMLENQIPHGYIASFLGITPVSLSRLRKELVDS